MAEPISIALSALSVLEKVLVYIEHVNKIKSRAERLNSVCQAWERTGWLKDQLIRHYESDKITDANKRTAKNIFRHLKKLQSALKALRKEINRDEPDDDEVDNMSRDINKLIDRIITLFVLK